MTSSRFKGHHDSLWIGEPHEIYPENLRCSCCWKLFDRDVDEVEESDE